MVVRVINWSDVESSLHAKGFTILLLQLSLELYDCEERPHFRNISFVNVRESSGEEMHLNSFPIN
ncbi:unnamed protein product [Cunninghamella echinulata]